MSDPTGQQMTPPDFLDEELLNKHVEHVCHLLHNGAIAKEKNSKWSFEFGFPFCLKVKAEETTQPRPATVFEKVSFLEQHLRKSDRLLETTNIPVKITNERCFCLETIEAQKVFIAAETAEAIMQRSSWLDIPPEEFSGPGPLGDRVRRDLNRQRRDEELRTVRKMLSGFKGLVVWFGRRNRSENAGEHSDRHLMLLISSGYREASCQGEAVHVLSAHGILTALYEEARADIENTIIYPYLEEIKRETLGEALSRDPLATLRRMKAHVEERRKITTLYLVRRIVPPNTVIGYPIFISAGPQIDR